MEGEDLFGGGGGDVVKKMCKGLRKQELTQVK